MTKLVVQGYTNMFLQGNVQRNFCKSEVSECYTNRIECGDFFSSTVRGVSITLVVDDLARILDFHWGLGSLCETRMDPYG